MPISVGYCNCLRSLSSYKLQLLSKLYNSFKFPFFSDWKVKKVNLCFLIIILKKLGKGAYFCALVSFLFFGPRGKINVAKKIPSYVHQTDKKNATPVSISQSKHVRYLNFQGYQLQYKFRFIHCFLFLMDSDKNRTCRFLFVCSLFFAFTSMRYVYICRNQPDASNSGLSLALSSPQVSLSLSALDNVFYLDVPMFNQASTNFQCDCILRKHNLSLVV